MNKLLSSEAAQASQHPHLLLMSVGAVVLVAGGVASIAAANTFNPGDHPGREALSMAGPAQTLRSCSVSSLSPTSSAIARLRRSCWCRRGGRG